MTPSLLGTKPHPDAQVPDLKNVLETIRSGELMEIKPLGQSTSGLLAKRASKDSTNSSSTEKPGGSQDTTPTPQTIIEEI